MLVSCAGLAAIVVADIAEAHTVAPVVDSDEPGPFEPVQVRKLTVRSYDYVRSALIRAVEPRRHEALPLDDEDLALDGDDEDPPTKKKSRKGISFGRFEGY
jgi:hypothetical protein